jgi:uncharacterized integral membrane protein
LSQGRALQSLNKTKESRKEVTMTKTIVFLILVALVIIFVLQNTQVVEFQFLAWKISMSRALLLLGTFVIGVIVGWLSRRLRPKESKPA